MEIYSKETKESARDYALRVLKGNIISLDLKPGTPISENDLAAQLGISRTPVREAIIELSKAYIIEIYPQRGSFVSLIDPKMVEEARFLRRVMGIYRCKKNGTAAVTLSRDPSLEMILINDKLIYTYEELIFCDN